MPSSPVHIFIAYEMSENKDIKIVNQADFILGAISPDCVNYGVEQASEEIRYKAHIRNRDYDIWKRNLEDFYKDNKEKYAEHLDFLKGYLFHSWCDIAWDEAVQPKLFEYLGTLGYGYDDMTKQKWQELYRFNSEIISHTYYTKGCELMLKGRAVDIAGCSAELIEKFAVYAAKDYKDKIIEEKPKFLSLKHIANTEEQMIKMGYTKFD